PITQTAPNAAGLPAPGHRFDLPGSTRTPVVRPEAPPLRPGSRRCCPMRRDRPGQRSAGAARALDGWVGRAGGRAAAPGPWAVGAGAVVVALARSLNPRPWWRQLGCAADGYLIAVGHCPVQMLVGRGHHQSHVGETAAVGVPDLTEEAGRGGVHVVPGVRVV